MKPTICTFTGIEFAPLAPTVDMIDYRDIAHALAQMPRFNGHTKHFFSVAQHSVGVSHICDKEDAGYGLMHDAAEAYLMDLPSPLKEIFPDYRPIENRVLAVIYEAFGLDPAVTKPASVKRADKQALTSERWHLMPTCDWWPKIQTPDYPLDGRYYLEPRVAKQAFERRMRALHVSGLLPKLPMGPMRMAA